MALEGRLAAIRAVLAALLVAQYLGGLCLLLSPVLAGGLAIAVPAVLGLWGLKRNDAPFLYAGAAAEAWVVWRIVGAGGVYDVLNAGLCGAYFGSDALCNTSWRAFLALVTLLVLLAALLLVPGLLYVLRESRVPHESASRNGKEDVAAREGLTTPLLP